MKFKKGDKVRLNKNIEKFKLGQGGVGYDEIGEITHIFSDGTIVVEFPTLPGWSGVECELILCNRKFFKVLPNNFTGTLEIENGYIVEKEILDEVEKEYLSSVIKPFRDRVQYIKKINLPSSEERLIISLTILEYVCLPHFNKGIMYKGMEQGKRYALEELGL